MAIPLLAVGAVAAFTGGGAGAAWLSGWFKKDAGKLPTKTLQKFLKEQFQANYTEIEIENLWQYYIDGTVQHGLKPFDYRDNPAKVNNYKNQPIVLYIAENLPGVALTRIRNFCFALQYAASSGVMLSKFWAPLQSTEAAKAVADFKAKAAIGQAPGVKTDLDKFASSAKWIGVSVAGLAGVYVISQIAGVFRKG